MNKVNRRSFTSVWTYNNFPIRHRKKVIIPTGFIDIKKCAKKTI